MVGGKWGGWRGRGSHPLPHTWQPSLREEERIWLFVFLPASAPSSSPQVHFKCTGGWWGCVGDYFLANRWWIFSLRDYKASGQEEAERNLVVSPFFFFTLTLKRHHLLVAGLQHRSASRGSRWVNEQALFTVFKQYPSPWIFSPQPANPSHALSPPPLQPRCLSSVGIMADLAGKAYGCHKSSSGVHLTATYKPWETGPQENQ